MSVFSRIKCGGAFAHFDHSWWEILYHINTWIGHLKLQQGLAGAQNFLWPKIQQLIKIHLICFPQPSCKATGCGQVATVYQEGEIGDLRYVCRDESHYREPAGIGCVTNNHNWC